MWLCFCATTSIVGIISLDAHPEMKQCACMQELGLTDIKPVDVGCRSSSDSGATGVVRQQAAREVLFAFGQGKVENVAVISGEFARLGSGTECGGGYLHLRRYA